MTTWKAGRRILRKKLASSGRPLAGFLEDPQMETIVGVPRMAIYVPGDPEGTPTALLHNLKHNKVLHQRVELLTIETAEVPRVDKLQCVRVNALGKGFLPSNGTVRLHWKIRWCSKSWGEPRIRPRIHHPRHDTFFLSRQNVVSTRRQCFARWRTKLFAFLLRNSGGPTDFCGLPPREVVELGMRIEL